MHSLFKFIKKKRKSTILVLAAFSIFYFTWGVYLPRYSQNLIEHTLASAGFKDVRASKVSVGFYTLTANDIYLDAFGFDKIKSLHIERFWPGLLFGGEPKSVTLEGVHISRSQENIRHTLQGISPLLLSLPAYRINMKDVMIDLSTDLGELRMTGDLGINNDNDSDNRDIKINLAAAQYQLGFESTWTGVLTKDGNLDLSGEIASGHMRSGAFSVARFTGWATLRMNEKNLLWQSQLDAGRAVLGGLPLKDVRWTHEIKPQRHSGLFRSEIAGIAKTRLDADFLYMNQARLFNAILKGDNLGEFAAFLLEKTSKKREIAPLLKEEEPFSLSFSFQPDRQFVGGPLPFSVDFNIDKENITTGNLLYYTDTAELKGALETDKKYTSALKDYLKIPDANISQNFIRIDGKVLSLIKVEDQKTQPD